MTEDAKPDASTADDDRHAMKMAKKKAARDKIMATKTDKKGLIIVHTGKGKGKSSAAFGMIFRCIAHAIRQLFPMDHRNSGRAFQWLLLGSLQRILRRCQGLNSCSPTSLRLHLHLRLLRS